MKKYRIIKCALDISVLLVAVCAGSEPSVTTSGGATNVGVGTATLQGLMTAGGAATAYFCWGAEEGTRSGASTGTWDHVSDAIAISDGVAFSNVVSNLYYGIEYNFAIYATNGNGDAWSSVTNFTTAVPTTWTPADMTTAAWYDGADTDTLWADSVGGTKATTTIAWWEDKSGNSKHLSQPTGASQPDSAASAIGGKHAVSFNGTSDYIYTSTGLGADIRSMFLIMKSDTAVTSASAAILPVSSYGDEVSTGVGLGGTTGALANEVLTVLDEDAPAVYVDRQGVSSTTLSTINTEAHVYSFVLGTTHWHIGFDGSANLRDLSNGTRHALGFASSFSVGAGTRRSGSIEGYLDGSIGEIICLSSSADTEDQAKLEGYLANKWGLQGNLPGGHQYKTDAPTGGAAALFGIDNTFATNETQSKADLLGSLDATQSVFTVSAYWSTSNNTSEAQWFADNTASNAVFGTYTNVMGLSLSNTVSSLEPSTTYYFTYMASNAETNIWADGNVTFSTLSNESAPSVDNNGGAAVGSGTATLRGLMTAGGSATAYICWGAEPGDTVDGADTGTWDFVSAAISVSDNVAFSNAVSNLYYGIAYDYAVYVTNSEGEDWSSVANFTTASGPFWTPADIDTLIWYDATDAGTITASGGAVSQWRDKSGNGYHVGQVTTTIQPTTGSRDINGLNAIDLARDDMLSGIFSKSPSSLQIAIVTEWDSGGQDYMSMLSMNRDKLDMRENNAASLQILWNGGDYLGSSPGPASFNTPFIAGLKWDGTDLAALVNGNVGTVKSPRPGPIALSGIRFSHSGYAFDGAIGEAIILESGDDALRQKVEGYLAHKWSMTDDLASGHPYKNVAPGAPAITNTVGANFTPSSADIVGTLYATNSVFTVHAYWSTNSYAGAAAWTNAVAGGTASNVLVGSYTNVTGHSVTGSVSGLLSGTDYYYTFMATNAVTNIWASPNGNFTTSAGAGQIAIANAAADNISNVTARLNATLDCPGTNATVIAYWWQTGSGTTNSFAIGPYSDETASSVSHTASGLSPKTAYSFTFRATNATDNIWTDSTNTFTTHEIPEVGNGAGPVLRWQALAGWTAVTLNGEIVATNGVPVTTVRIYFGDNNPGAETADGWDITYAFPSVTGVGAFSTNITDLLYDETYYYTVYASNAYGAAWSTVTSITTGRDLWIPTNLAAEAWYDAADSSKVTLDDGKVRWWRDVSGNGKDAEQTTPANRPSTGGDIGGLNALVFDGDNYRLDTALEQLTTCTIVIVAGPSANGANHESVLLSATLASSTSGGLYLNTENYLTGDARHNVNYGSGILGSQKSYNGEVAASPSVFQNGIFAHWGSGFSTENRNYKIGNRHDNWNNGHYKGTIGEIIIIPSVLSDRIRQKVEGYLAHKWGLEGRLPTGHPYINNPPYASDRDSTVFRFR